MSVFNPAKIDVQAHERLQQSSKPDED